MSAVYVDGIDIAVKSVEKRRTSVPGGPAIQSMAHSQHLATPAVAQPPRGLRPAVLDAEITGHARVAVVDDHPTLEIALLPDRRPVLKFGRYMRHVSPGHAF